MSTKLSTFRQKLREWFTPSFTGSNPEDFQQRIAEYIIGVGTVLTTFLVIIHAFSGDMLRLVPNAIVLVVFAGVYYALKRQMLVGAMRFLYIFLILALSIGLTFNGGLSDPGLHTVHVVLASIAIILGPIELIYGAIALITWILALYIANVFGLWIPGINPVSPFDYALQIFGYVVMNVIYTSIAIGQITSSRELLQKERDKAKVINQGLQESEQTLERNVADRTTLLQQRIEELNQADKVRNQFLGNITHELRTPLNGIINLTYIVSEELAGPVNEEQKGHLKQALTSSTDLLDLVNDVLDMTKIQADRLNLYIEDDVDLYQEWDQVFTTVQSKVESNQNVKLISKLAENLPIIACDRRRLRQILSNLVSNSIKFTKSGEITVTVVQEDNDIHFAVSDTGIGISPELQARIFEPFFQTDDTAAQIQGTGLGLPITKSLVEAHNGRLQIESEPEKGSIFHIWLPITPSASTNQQQ